MKKSIQIRIIYMVTVFATMILTGCTEPKLFSTYQKVMFPVTRVSESSVKTIEFLNNSNKSVQHILSVEFYAGSNDVGHYQVKEVRVGTEVADLKDIFVPPMGVLSVDVTYTPLDLITTEAGYAGWVTSSSDKGRMEDFPQAISIMGNIMKGANKDASAEETEDYRPAIHRAVLVVTYDSPAEGYSEVEFIGGAIPGPNGEMSAAPMGGLQRTECVVGGTQACFNGSFSIHLPSIMSSGPMEVPLTSPVPITVDGSTSEMNMDLFPPVLIVIKGNGPGEPLEGKPVDAISIIISGTEGAVGKGTFDGSNLTLSGIGFRIRMDLKEITEDMITPKLNMMVDFNVTELDVFTEEPFDGENIVFGVDTTLSEAPSGNGLVDPFLGGAQVIVRFNGKLELP